MIRIGATMCLMLRSMIHPTRMPCNLPHCFHAMERQYHPADVATMAQSIGRPENSKAALYDLFEFLTLTVGCKNINMLPPNAKDNPPSQHRSCVTSKCSHRSPRLHGPLRQTRTSSVPAVRFYVHTVSDCST